MTCSMIEAARWYVRQGWHITPIRPGTKAAYIAKWPSATIHTTDQVDEHWGKNPSDGMGVVLGATGIVSIDVDIPSQARDLCRQHGVDLETVLAQGIRLCGNPARAKALFRAPAGIQMVKRPELELRAGNVQDVLPPSGHPETKGMYVWIDKPCHVDQVPVLPAEMATMWRRLSSRDEHPEALALWQGQRPGDEFNETASWAEILEPHGWVQAGHEPGATLWRRPGKKRGNSARVKDEDDLLWIYTSNAPPFEGDRSYSKFAAYAVLNCGGDFSRARVELENRGYGERHTSTTQVSVKTDQHRVLANVYYETITQDDGTEKTYARRVKLPDIAEMLAQLCHGELRRVNKEHLFVDRRNGGGIREFRTTDELFTWIQEQSFDLVWKNTGSDSKGRPFVTRAELMCHLISSRAIPEYTNISDYPTYPERSDVYVAHRVLPAPDPARIAEFRAFFKPSSPVDEAVLAALHRTLFWGGPGGQRPVFVVLCKSQQESGKSALVEHAASLVGGAASVQLGKRTRETIRGTLLSDIGRGYRVALMDNVTAAQRSRELAELTTSKTIMGDSKFKATARRHNDVVFALTTNSPAMSTDIASRTFVIEIDPADQTADPHWDARLTNFIRQNRWGLVSDLLAELAQEGIRPSVHPSRFPTWALDVLAKGPFAARVDDVLTHRLQSVSEYDEEVDTLLLWGQTINQTYRYGANAHVTSTEAAEVWNRITGERKSAVALARQVLRPALEGGKYAWLDYKVIKGVRYWVIQRSEFENGSGVQDDGSGVQDEPAPENMSNIDWMDDVVKKGCRMDNSHPAPKNQINTVELDDRVQDKEDQGYYNACTRAHARDRFQGLYSASCTLTKKTPQQSENTHQKGCLSSCTPSCTPAITDKQTCQSRCAICNSATLGATYCSACQQELAGAIQPHNNTPDGGQS